MKTSKPRTQMASYLERWEEQKVQSRIARQKQQRRRSSDVGDELSFISAIEREAAQQDERYDAELEAVDHQYEGAVNASFDFPPMDAFPASEVENPAQEQQKMPTDDEFMDAAAFLKQNELGGDDSFSQDIGTMGGDNWDQTNSSGRPSDFFERKSRNLDHVELSSPRNVEDALFQGDDGEDEVAEPGLRTSKEELSPTDPRQGLALHDHFDRSSGLSRSGTAFSSGYEVHFDNARLMYTPNSLKHLQDKERFKSANEKRNVNEPEHVFVDHTREAETVMEKAPSLPDEELPEDPSPQYVAALQRGPGVIKESLHEIDALIDNSLRLAASPMTKDPIGVELSEDMREFVRDYERPLESMLPLSRTTDSWGEDASISQVDDDINRQSRDFERLSSGTEPSRQNVNGVRRSRSQETPELDTIREVPCPSNTDSASRSQRSADSRNQYSKAVQPQTQNLELEQLDSPVDNSAQARRGDHLRQNSNKASQVTRKIFSGINSKRSDGLKSLATSATLDQSLAEVAATQNSFRDEGYRSKVPNKVDDDDDERLADVAATQNPFQCDQYRSKVSDSEEHHENDSGGSFADCHDYERNEYSGDRINEKTAHHRYEDSEPDEIDRDNVRFRYGEDAQHLRSAPRRRHVDEVAHSRRRGMNDYESRPTAVQKQPVASDRLRDVLERNKLHVTMETAMIPRRCRRFLCSVGDIMTEQIVFTNGTNSVGRICVSLLPLSTGCQQFSVSPAVLELGPKASSAFHVSFNARYAGAVSGIFQFRGVGIESLFHPYEVVIEASVKRHLGLEAPRDTRLNHLQEETDTSERVQELQASSSVDQVDISPTFIRFDRARSKSGEKMIRRAKLRLANNTSQTLPFKVRALENLRIRPATGMIQPASEVIVSVLPISQPFVQQRTSGDSSSNNPSPRAENWFGSLTVQVGKNYLREVSVVVDRRVIQTLPPFDEIARSRHQLSPQTDSFYYTKRGKRRGLYFHARAVEFGCCNVGESHEVPVYVCNGSKAPITVFLQDLQEPFSCAYSTTTIEPRKFIEVMVTFTPKVVGKVATSLFAYSVSDKAVVTLVARGI